MPIKQNRHRKKLTPAVKEGTAHNTPPSHLDRDGRTNQKTEGHHRNETDKPTDALEVTENPWIVKSSRKPRKDAPAPIHTKATDTPKHTNKKHGHAPRGGTAFRITKDIRGSIMLHQEGTNIERIILTLTGDPGTDKMIKNALAKGHTCAKKNTASKQQGQEDHGNIQTALSPKGPKIKPKHGIGQPSAPTGRFADPPPKKSMVHLSHQTEGTE